MHYAISTTWGPTDITRGALPFIFAASALLIFLIINIWINKWQINCNMNDFVVVFFK